MNGLLALQEPVVMREGAHSPAADPDFLVGTNLRFTCPVTSHCNASVQIKVVLKIYEGSIWPGHGTLLAQYESDPLVISPEQTLAAIFTYVAEHPSEQDRRDVAVVVLYWDGSDWIEGATDEWDDFFYVKPLAYDFEIGEPTVEAAA